MNELKNEEKKWHLNAFKKFIINNQVINNQVIKNVFLSVVVVIIYTFSKNIK